MIQLMFVDMHMWTKTIYVHLIWTSGASRFCWKLFKTMLHNWNWWTLLFENCQNPSLKRMSAPNWWLSMDLDFWNIVPPFSCTKLAKLPFLGEYNDSTQVVWKDTRTFVLDHLGYSSTWHITFMVKNFKSNN